MATITEQLANDIIILGEDCGALGTSGNGNGVGIKAAKKSYNNVKKSLAEFYKQYAPLMKKGPKTRTRVSPGTIPTPPPVNDQTQFQLLSNDVIILGDDCGVAANGNIAVKNTLRGQFKSIQGKIKQMGLILFGDPIPRKRRSRTISSRARE